jgi:hypothetical protein
VVDDFIDRIMQQTLDKFAVPLAEQAEIKAIMASTGPTSSFEQHGGVSLIRVVIGALFTGSSM